MNKNDDLTSVTVVALTAYSETFNTLKACVATLSPVFDKIILQSMVMEIAKLEHRMCILLVNEIEQTQPNIHIPAFPSESDHVKETLEALDIALQAREVLAAMLDLPAGRSTDSTDILDSEEIG